MNVPKLRSPIIVALDMDDPVKALEAAEELKDVVGCFKIGPRLLTRLGEEGTRNLAAKAPLFIDCKYFDIPSTMEAAVRAAFDLGATFVTVHALAGLEALTRLKKIQDELSKERPFVILCVTVLTSWDQASLPPSMKPIPISEHVTALAQLAEAAGLKGLVCSPQELSLLQGKGFYLVTPGVRLDLQDSHDQKRVLGPSEAMAAGASALVVGRPILEARNPREMAMDFAVAAFEHRGLI